MKRLAILTILIVATQACHRKQYSLFNDPVVKPYLDQVKISSAVRDESAMSADAKASSTSIEAGQGNVPESSLALSIAENSPQVPGKKKLLKAKKLSEQKAKPIFHSKPDKPKLPPPKVQGIASLVFGSIGLFMVLLFGLEFINVVGLLLSIALGAIGLILGVVGLLRSKRDSAEPSGRAAAIVGILLSLGAIVITTVILGLSK